MQGAQDIPCELVAPLRGLCPHAIIEIHVRPYLSHRVCGRVTDRLHRLTGPSGVVHFGMYDDRGTSDESLHQPSGQQMDQSPAYLL